MCSPGMNSGRQSAMTTEANPTRRPAAARVRVSGSSLAEGFGCSHSRIRSLPSLDSSARYPATVAQNTIVVPRKPRDTLSVNGSVNSSSSGSPASAALRSRTAIRSVSRAAIPTPAAASSTMPRSSGTGGAYCDASLNPSPARCSRAASDAGVGSRCHSDLAFENARLR
jgi:hypothetical protein